MPWEWDFRYGTNFLQQEEQIDLVIIEGLMAMHTKDREKKDAKKIKDKASGIDTSDYENEDDDEDEEPSMSIERGPEKIGYRDDKQKEVLPDNIYDEIPNTADVIRNDDPEISLLARQHNKYNKQILDGTFKE